MDNSAQKTIQKAASGDRMAFRQLVLDNSQAMFRLAWRLTGDEALAEDIVQEAFVKAWKKLGKFRMESSFRSWLHRITVNTAMDFLRKKSRQQTMETADSGWDSLQEASEPAKADVRIDISTQTHAALKKLSDQERTALILRHFEGCSINEVANIMNLSAGACKQTIFRAVRKMRIELEPLVAT